MHVARGRACLSILWMFAAACAWPALARAQVSFEPGQVRFEPTFVGKTSAPQAVTLTNSSRTAVFVMNGSGAPGDYAVQGSNCPFSSAASLVPFGPGASCTITFQFTPSIAGSDDGSYVIQIVDASFQSLGSAVLTLGGTGQFPLVFSATALDFGYVRENLNSAPALPLTITNAGGVLVSFAASITNPDYSVDALSCERGFFAPGASCIVEVSFNPTITGSDPASLVVSAVVLGAGPDLGRVVVPVAGVGHPLEVSPSLDFGIDLLGGAYRQSVSVFNGSDAPIAIRSAAVTGAPFSKDDGCIGALAARTSCAIAVTFTPTATGPASGTITLVSEDPTSPQVIPLTATGTALTIAAEFSAPGSQTFAFFDQPLGTTSPAQTVTLTNVSTKPVAFKVQLAVDNRSDFSSVTTCRKSEVPARGTCVVSVTYTPAVDGTSRDMLTITPADPIGPERVTLLGDGVGIARRRVLLHYDYMVAADHTHDPEALSPGTIQRVVDAFARHGVELIVDPHHAAIPEVETVSFSEDPAPRIVCPDSQANFLDLRDRYFTRKFADQHYAIFSHFLDGDEPFRCTPATGEADLPGLDFVVALGGFTSFSADYVSFATSGTLMHELGHNLGLHHGGGYGVLHDDETNYKPNYLSIMNYNHQLSGIVQSRAIGSTSLSQCLRDSDCGFGQSCVAIGLGDSSVGSCRRLDYSTESLPIGGNTPGALDEHDLDETAGLGSWTTDLGDYSTCQPGGAPAFGVVAANGPVDWDGDGTATDRHLAIDVDFRSWGVQFDCSQPLRRLDGFDDWALLLQTGAGAGEGGMRETSAEHADASSVDRLANPERHHPQELDADTARRQHVLAAPREAELMVVAGCRAQNTVAADPNGLVVVALLAAVGFDVRQVDVGSLRVRRARPVKIELADVNADALPDLVLSFRASDLVSSRGGSTRLSGWLLDSQQLFGDGDVPPCRP